jgi:hypothetical protein
MCHMHGSITSEKQCRKFVRRSPTWEMDANFARHQSCRIRRRTGNLLDLFYKHIFTSYLALFVHSFKDVLLRVVCPKSSWGRALCGRETKRLSHARMWCLSLHINGVSRRSYIESFCQVFWLPPILWHLLLATLQLSLDLFGCLCHPPVALTHRRHLPIEKSISANKQLPPVIRHCFADNNTPPPPSRLPERWSKRAYCSGARVGTTRPIWDKQVWQHL